ncbi:hypothetical protein QCA50_007686 [Cerrena zonata]|uniref:Zn(2)-C6 fungal-type domain-containing protein n=1 Tax=Cerrena zonata TaxID=2478898 RepID=A0AAW0G694_9APHY
MPPPGIPARNVAKDDFTMLQQLISHLADFPSAIDSSPEPQAIKNKRKPNNEKDEKDNKKQTPQMSRVNMLTPSSTSGTTPPSAAQGKIFEVTTTARQNTPACTYCRSKEQNCITTNLERLRCDACLTRKKRCSLSRAYVKKSTTQSGEVSEMGRAKEDDSEPESESEEPPRKKTRSQVVPAKKGTEKDRKELSDAREDFFKVLKDIKEELGGQHSEAFKKLHFSAMMWQAQEAWYLS